MAVIAQPSRDLQALRTSQRNVTERSAEIVQPRRMRNKLQQARRNQTSNNTRESVTKDTFCAPSYTWRHSQGMNLKHNISASISSSLLLMLVMCSWSSSERVYQLGARLEAPGEAQGCRIVCMLHKMSALIGILHNLKHFAGLASENLLECRNKLSRW